MSDMKPKVNSKGAQELDKAQEELNQFNIQMKEAAAASNALPAEETEPQVKMSNREMQAKTDIYLKPVKTIGSREKFNEIDRKEYNFKKEYVNFVAEHSELIGSKIEKWTKPFAGMPAEYWEVPCNVPVWGPRYLAEEIKGCTYNRLEMDESASAGSEGGVNYYGRIVIAKKIQRLDARPVNQGRSIFM